MNPNLRVRCQLSSVPLQTPQITLRHLLRTGLGQVPGIRIQAGEGVSAHLPARLCSCWCWAPTCSFRLLSCTFHPLHPTRKRSGDGPLVCHREGIRDCALSLRGLCPKSDLGCRLRFYRWRQARRQESPVSANTQGKYFRSDLQVSALRP